MLSGEESQDIWDRIIPIPLWMTAALMLFAGIGLVTVMVFISRLLLKALTRQKV